MVIAPNRINFYSSSLQTARVKIYAAQPPVEADQGVKGRTEKASTEPVKLFASSNRPTAKRRNRDVFRSQRSATIEELSGTCLSKITNSIFNHKKKV